MAVASAWFCYMTICCGWAGDRGGYVNPLAGGCCGWWSCSCPCCWRGGGGCVWPPFGCWVLAVLDCCWHGACWWPMVYCWLPCVLGSWCLCCLGPFDLQGNFCKRFLWPCADRLLDESEASTWLVDEALGMYAQHLVACFWFLQGWQETFLLLLQYLMMWSFLPHLRHMIGQPVLLCRALTLSLSLYMLSLYLVTWCYLSFRGQICWMVSLASPILRLWGWGRSGGYCISAEDPVVGSAGVG